MQVSNSSDVISNLTRWKEFLLRYYREDLIKLASSESKSKPLYINYNDLVRFDFRIAQELIIHPDKVIKTAEDAISVIDLPVRMQLDNIKIRISKLPRKILIRNIRSEHINKLLSIDAYIRKITTVRPRIIVAAFECARCGDIVRIPQDSTGKFLEPAYCDCNEDKKGIFKRIDEECEYVDYQRARIQESFEDLRGGEQPQTIDIKLQEDLAGVLIPGQHIIVNGILRHIQKINKDGKTADFELYIDVQGLELDKQEYEELNITVEDVEKIKALVNDKEYNKKIIKSIAPSICGLDDIKETIALQFFSGVRKYLPDGTTKRGDIHVLLVGDPGVAKSQLLLKAINLSPRGMYSNGASKAGLTAAAVKDDFGEGNYTIEAGVVVLADKGFAAIDEMDKMRLEDAGSLTQAMEQQFVSVDKAGVHMHLNSECSIIAAANPKDGRFDVYESLQKQINIPAPLLTRFDLIFVLQDIPNPELDAKVSDHIIKTNRVASLNERYKHIQNSGIDKKDLDEQIQDIIPDIDPQLFRKLVAYAKRNIFPIWTEEAGNLIQKHFIKLRQMGKNDSNAPVAMCFRQLEGLQRLAEASARMRLSDNVETRDAEKAINIMMMSLAQTCIDPDTGKMDIDKITVGITRSQQEKMKLFRKLIDDNSEGKNGVSRETLVQLCDVNRLNDVQGLIDKNKEIAAIEELPGGRFRTC